MCRTLLVVTFRYLIQLEYIYLVVYLFKARPRMNFQCPSQSDLMIKIVLRFCQVLTFSSMNVYCISRNCDLQLRYVNVNVFVVHAYLKKIQLKEFRLGWKSTDGTAHANSLVTGPVH